MSEQRLPQDRLMELALVGSRMPGFHHDCASKLQSLMMALDELSELSEDAEPMARSAIDTAHTALRELHQMFTANRALTKPAQRTNTSIDELVQRAADRVGVKVRGTLTADTVRVAVPAITHALSQLLDLAAGPSHLGRVVDVSVEAGERVTLVIVGPKEALAKVPANAQEVLALATFVIDRERGTLRVDERIEIVLPRETVTDQLPKTT